jgi:hypothetical protein
MLDFIDWIGRASTGLDRPVGGAEVTHITGKNWLF